MYSREYMFETIRKICDHFGLIAYECFDFDFDGMILKIKIEDQQRNDIDTIKIDSNSFNKDTLDGLWNKLSNKLSNKAPTAPAEKHAMGWRPISEYSREKYDWVLVKYFHESFECLPEVAEMRVDERWYNRTGTLIDPDIFEVKYFFDMQQLDKEV